MKGFLLRVKAILLFILEEFARASIASSMWTDGYYDVDIDETIRQMFPKDENESE